MRRSPPRAVAASPVEGNYAPPPKPIEAPPLLLLVGAVVGEGDAIAILVNRIDQKVVRLRQWRIARRLVAHLGSAARGDIQAERSQRGPGAAAAGSSGLSPDPTADPDRFRER